MQHFFAVISDKELEAIKIIAMNKHSVKKSKQPHIKAILDDAFRLAMERNGNNIDNGYEDNE